MQLTICSHHISLRYADEKKEIKMKQCFTHWVFHWFCTLMPVCPKDLCKLFFFFVGPDTYIIFQGALRQDSKRAKDFQSQWKNCTGTISPGQRISLDYVTASHIVQQLFPAARHSWLWFHNVEHFFVCCLICVTLTLFHFSCFLTFCPA